MAQDVEQRRKDKPRALFCELWQILTDPDKAILRKESKDYERKADVIDTSKLQCLLEGAYRFGHLSDLDSGQGPTASRI